MRITQHIQGDQSRRGIDCADLCSRRSQGSINASVDASVLDEIEVFHSRHQEESIQQIPLSRVEWVGIPQISHRCHLTEM